MPDIDPETAPKKCCVICGSQLAAYNKGNRCFHHPAEMEADLADGHPARDIPGGAQKLLLAVCDYFKISLPVLRGTSLNRELTHARQIAMYLLLHDGKLDKKEIGWIFHRHGNKIYYPLERIRYLVQTDSSVAEQIQQIRTTME